MEIKSTKIKYGEIVPELRKKVGRENLMSLPKIKKLVINSGTGKYAKDAGFADEVFETIRTVSGQHPMKTRAKKAISGFKTRKGQEIGVAVNLRGRRMWQFVDKLINTALPRIKDFQGIKESAVDSHGNLSIGLKEQIVFPEISPEKIKNTFGLEINISTTARNKEEGLALFRLLGFPMQK